MPATCPLPWPPSQEREQQRMAALEAEWRRRERAREAEAAGLRGEYAALEAKARQVLAAAEEREARLVAADEALARRRTDLERDHAARMAEAEAAVRRLQVECEHQLSIERDRGAEAGRLRAAAEARAAAAEAALVEFKWVALGGRRRGAGQRPAGARGLQVLMGGSSAVGPV
jgi:hypothetical protein